MCFCSSLSEDALNWGGILDLNSSSHLPSFTIRILSTYCVVDTKIYSSYYPGPMSWEISSSPPLRSSLNPHPTVCVYHLVRVIEDCGKITHFGEGRPVFKFWLCSLPAV